MTKKDHKGVRKFITTFWDFELRCRSICLYTYTIYIIYYDIYYEYKKELRAFRQGYNGLKHVEIISCRNSRNKNTSTATATYNIHYSRLVILYIRSHLVFYNCIYFCLKATYPLGRSFWSFLLNFHALHLLKATKISDLS